MEASAGRSSALPPASSSQATRKEWRAVLDHSFRSNGSEDPEYVTLAQSDERTIYEEGTGPLEVDFCSITIDNDEELSDDKLQQRLREITRQREELQHMEIELRAQAIARSGILEVQNNFQVQLKENTTATAKLKEQLLDREKHILELELKLEEKDRELRAMKIDTEAAWAKEDLLREQNKELASFRRERDNSEAERLQHLNQIRDLQEHIQEKESQFLALEEQHRVAQETMIFKDEQLREAQAWIARAQEMDALQSSTNQSLQAELRERTEQFNQYWMGLQHQFIEMERHHMQAMQQLQLELAEARERNGKYNEGSHTTIENSADSSSYIQENGNTINVNNGGKANGAMGFTSKGSMDATSSYVSVPNPSTKAEHVPSVPVVPSSILGMGAFLPPGQMNAVQPYLMTPQGVPHSVASTNSPIPQSHVAHFQPISAIPAQHLLAQQVPIQSSYPPSQTEHDIIRADAHYNFDLSGERQIVHSDHLKVHDKQHQRSDSATNGSSEVQELESNGEQYVVSQEQGTLDTNSQCNSELDFGPAEQESKKVVLYQDENIVTASNQSLENLLRSGQQWSSATVSQNYAASSNGSGELNESKVKFPDVSIPASHTASILIPGKAVEPNLLDERSLLACIVRAIPAGSDGRIRISTTLPNRLGKMLAPLHWHDYKKKYGKLDDFVAHHPELFLIEGDFIHLREGAQEIIAATTAVAKVAAAAASSPYSSLLPSVAVTPVAQTSRQKKVQSVESKTANTVSYTDGAAFTNTGDSSEKHPEILKRQDQQKQCINFNIVQGLSDATISSRLKNNQEANGLPSHINPNYSSALHIVGNATNVDRTSLASQNKGVSNGRHNLGGRHHGRSSGAGFISRR